MSTFHSFLNFYVILKGCASLNDSCDIWIYKGFEFCTHHKNFALFPQSTVYGHDHHLSYPVLPQIIHIRVIVCKTQSTPSFLMLTH